MTGKIKSIVTMLLVSCFVLILTGFGMMFHARIRQKKELEKQNVQNETFMNMDQKKGEAKNKAVEEQNDTENDVMEKEITQDEPSEENENDDVWPGDEEMDSDTDSVYIEGIDFYPPGCTTVKNENVQKEGIDSYFKLHEIDSSNVYDKVVGKIIQPDEVENYQYLKLLYYDYKGTRTVGELVVSKKLGSAYRKIFKEFYQLGYQFNKIGLIEDYWPKEPTGNLTADADYADTLAADQNITYCDYYKGKYGERLNINPEQNPYVWKEDGEWVCTSHPDVKEGYINRTMKGDPHMIQENDFCVNIMEKYGFQWDWKVDENTRGYRFFVAKTDK